MQTQIALISFPEDLYQTFSQILNEQGVSVCATSEAAHAIFYYAPSFPFTNPIKEDIFTAFWFSTEATLSQFITTNRQTHQASYVIPATAITLSAYITQTLYYIAIFQNQKMQNDAFLESEAKSDAILRSTVSGIITIDENGLIESFNPAAEHIFGYNATEVIGKNISILMPQPYKREHDTYLNNYKTTGEAHIIGTGREVTGIRKNGETFPLELAVNDVKLPNRRIFSGIVRDISARRALERALLSISEHERRRIGQELHDGLGQMLTGIGLMCDNIQRLLKEEAHSLAGNMQRITQHIEEADTFARLLARGLVPVQLENNGLATALFRLCEQIQQNTGIICIFESTGDLQSFYHEEAIQLYRIAQEAMNNAIKHGQATQIQVFFAVSTAHVRLRVQNNGIAFPTELPQSKGIGLDIMAYRAKLLGASLDIKKSLKGGTLLTCTIPLKPKPEIENV